VSTQLILTQKIQKSNKLFHQHFAYISVAEDKINITCLLLLLLLLVVVVVVVELAAAAAAATTVESCNASYVDAGIESQVWTVQLTLAARDIPEEGVPQQTERQALDSRTVVRFL